MPSNAVTGSAGRIVLPTLPSDLLRSATASARSSALPVRTPETMRLGVAEATSLASAPITSALTPLASAAWDGDNLP